MPKAEIKFQKRGHWLLISLGYSDHPGLRFLWAGDFVVENR